MLEIVSGGVCPRCGHEEIIVVDPDSVDPDSSRKCLWCLVDIAARSAARGRIVDDWDWEDCKQEAALRIWERLRLHAADARGLAYLFSIGKYAALDCMLAIRERQERISYDEAHLTQEGARDETAELLDDARIQMLTSALRHQRSVTNRETDCAVAQEIHFLQLCLERRPLYSIAMELSIPEGTAASLRARLLPRLERILAGEAPPPTPPPAQLAARAREARCQARREREARGELLLRPNERRALAVLSTCPDARIADLSGGPSGLGYEAARCALVSLCTRGLVQRSPWIGGGRSGGYRYRLTEVGERLLEQAT